MLVAVSPPVVAISRPLPKSANRIRLGLDAVVSRMLAVFAWRRKRLEKLALSMNAAGRILPASRRASPAGHARRGRLRPFRPRPAAARCGAGEQMAFGEHAGILNSLQYGRPLKPALNVLGEGRSLQLRTTGGNSRAASKLDAQRCLLATTAIRLGA